MRNDSHAVKTTGMSIRNKIMISFGVLLLLLALISGNALYRLSEAKGNITEIVTEVYPTTALANDLIR